MHKIKINNNVLIYLKKFTICPISAFDQQSLKKLLTAFVPLTMVYGFASLTLLVASEFFGVFSDKNLGFIRKSGKLLKVLCYALISASMFAISLVCTFFSPFIWFSN